MLLYSAYADSAMVVPAILAGADGLLNKSAPAPELFDALRAVARGDRVLPPVPRELLESAGARVEPGDLPILAMMVDGTPIAEVAEAHAPAGHRDVARRVDAMIERLRVEIAAV